MNISCEPSGTTSLTRQQSESGDSAISGTGKSTHTRLWREMLGERAVMVNDDKPIIRVQDGTVTVFGTPWNGKEQLGCNMRTPLRHICFIERAEQNSCEPMTDTSEAINRIFNQVYMPKDPVALAKTMELINRLIDSVSLWKIKCNMDPSAAAVAYNTIFGK